MEPECVIKFCYKIEVISIQFVLQASFTFMQLQKYGHTIKKNDEKINKAFNNRSKLTILALFFLIDIPNNLHRIHSSNLVNMVCASACLLSCTLVR